MERGELIALVVGGAAAVGLGAFALWPRKKVPPGPDTASLGEDLEALARGIASEAGGEPRAVQVAVGWAIQNLSLARGKSIYRAARGTADEWGSQGSGGREFSSRLHPNAKHLDIARAVLSGDEPDPTGGATQFDSPRAQRALLKSRPDIYKKTPEQVAAARRADGKVMVLLAGIPEDQIRFWRQG
jgi:spore germination cell wall hydrolase CwlJ-like protein